MGRRKKVDSENIKNEEIKAVNNSEISLKKTKTCDRDVVTISETLPPQPTLHNNTHPPSSTTLYVTPVSLIDSVPPSSCPNSSACGPANTMENLNAPAIPEGNRLMVLHSILDLSQP
ncbi:hypothetical protein LUQ84_002653 [Hamiltosporidium tvaerminnensis]|nr:hypothetical protein LUQ84_002653 [Hamiltosporidium tvaerminnensis]